MAKIYVGVTTSHFSQSGSLTWYAYHVYVIRSNYLKLKQKSKALVEHIPAHPGHPKTSKRLKARSWFTALKAKPYYSKLQPLIFIGLFGMMGAGALLVTRAAGPAEVIEGTLMSYHGDDFQAKVSRNVYFVKAADNTEHYLDIKNNEKLPYNSGDKVRVQGNKSGNRFKVSPNNKGRADIKLISKDQKPTSLGNTTQTVAATKTAQSDSNTTKGNVLAATTAPTDKKALIILFNFSNDKSKPYNSEHYRDRVFTAPYSLNAHYQDMSYGKADKLVGKKRPEGDVADWVTIERDNSDCGANFRTWIYLARREAGKGDKNFLDGYDQIFYIFPNPPGKDACPWSGLQSVAPFSFFESDLKEILLPLYSGLPYPGAIEHEYGHTLDLKHASSVNCQDDNHKRVIMVADPLKNCIFDEYGDFYDVMGGPSSNKDPEQQPGTAMSGHHKEKLGWMPASQIQTVSTSGVYVLASSNKPASDTQVLRIPTPDGGYYYIEYVPRVSSGGSYSPKALVRLEYPGRDGINPDHTINKDSNRPILDLGRTYIDTSLMWLHDMNVINSPNQYPEYRNYMLDDIGEVLTDPVTKVSFKMVAHTDVRASIEVTYPGPPPPIDRGYVGSQGTSGSAGAGTLTTDLIFVSHPNPDCTMAGDNFGGSVDLGSASIGTTGAMYVGPATAAWQIDQTDGPYYDGGWGYAGPHSDDGTYGTSRCTNGSLGDPWPVTATITGTNSAGDTISCDYTGNYSRTNTKDVNLSNIDGDCTVSLHNSSVNKFQVVNDSWRATIGNFYDTGGDPFIPEYTDLYDFTLEP